MPEVVTYLKNKFVFEKEALVNVQERAFRFGDGVFETIRVVKGSPYQWDLHIQRLEGGLQQYRIDYELSNLRNICDELIEKNELKEGFLRISISRGIGSKGYLPDVKDGATLVVETVPPAPEIIEPVDLFLSTYRKIPDICLPSNVKSMQGVNSSLARLEATENDCFEALLLDINGHICEGSSSNIFWAKGKELFTPCSNILRGTMRDAVMRLSPYKVHESDYSLDDLKNADEVFVTNSAWIVLSIKELHNSNYIWNCFDIAKELRDLVLDDIQSS